MAVDHLKLEGAAWAFLASWPMKPEDLRAYCEERFVPKLREALGSSEGPMFRSVSLATEELQCVRCPTRPGRPAIAWAKMSKPNVTLNGRQLDFITSPVCRACGLEIQKEAAETNAQVEITEIR